MRVRSLRSSAASAFRSLARDGTNTPLAQPWSLRFSVRRRLIWTCAVPLLRMTSTGIAMSVRPGEPLSCTDTGAVEIVAGAETAGGGGGAGEREGAGRTAEATGAGTTAAARAGAAAGTRGGGATAAGAGADGRTAAGAGRGGGAGRAGGGAGG